MQHNIRVVRLRVGTDTYCKTNLQFIFADLVFIFTIGGVAVRNVIGWPAFILLSVLLVITSIMLLIKLKPSPLRWRSIPVSLIAFLGLAALSIAWSQYRLESLLGTLILFATTAAAFFVAFALSWAEFVRALGGALRWLLLGSLVFELIISIFVRSPLYIWWVEAPEPGERSLKLLMWSRDQLFDGGPIQGLFGNSTLLGFTALLGLIVFMLQVFSRGRSSWGGWLWVGLSILLIVLTRSSTVTLATLAVGIALLFALWARALSRNPRQFRSRTALYGVMAAIISGLILIFFFSRNTIFEALGKRPDLTGRVETWEKVITLGEQRPIFGWGWVSYWAPWVEPFKSLDTKNNIQVMHAHNAWLDVWFQLGFLGLIIFLVLALATLLRTWFFAVDRPRRFTGELLDFEVSSLAPLLIMVALLVQSLAESRLLVEGGWLLLVSFALLPAPEHSRTAEFLRRAPSWRPGAASLQVR